ncbi:hypothetical protein [Botrimarina hoheduenensis]|uniref:Uncharacterized protein n=1 Tax=Botrimarina hoheduenensis TaxID=2528000 RepID=A0A5C5W8L6_9BACT|nr:hypothetical protein [Botrimarina hoheduenensis]TWT47238.1 hypothetical protein Pla111_08500 [Botrimarina hoheduenensis]
MPKPRDEEDDLFHSEADVEFVDDDAKAKPKRKVAKKKAVKKKVAKKAAPKRTKKVAREPAPESAAPADDQADADDTPETESARPRRPRRKAVAGADVEIAPRKKKPAVPKKTKSSAGGFGAGLGLEDDPATAAAAPTAKPTEDLTAAQKGQTASEEASDQEAQAEKKPVADEYGRPEPLANYVVHVYELGRHKRTIERDFTPEHAEAYAREYSRTAKHYGRSAVAGKKDTQPAKTLD